MGLLSNKVVMEKEFLKEGSRRRRYRKKQMTFYYVVIVKSIYSNPIILFYTSSSLTFLERNVTHRCSFCGTWLPLFNVSYLLALYRLSYPILSSFLFWSARKLIGADHFNNFSGELWDAIVLFDKPDKKAYCFQGQIPLLLDERFYTRRYAKMHKTSCASFLLVKSFFSNSFWWLFEWCGHNPFLFWDVMYKSVQYNSSGTLHQSARVHPFRSLERDLLFYLKRKRRIMI